MTNPKICLKTGLRLNLTTAATAARTKKTKGLMNRTIAGHVRYKLLYISWPHSAIKQRDKKLFVFGEREREPLWLIF